MVIDILRIVPKIMLFGHITKDIDYRMSILQGTARKCRLITNILLDYDSLKKTIGFDGLEDYRK